MAELHIIGQILHGTNYEEPNLFCKWSIQYGNNWETIFPLLISSIIKL